MANDTHLIHPLWVRITHWANVVAVVTMAISGRLWHKFMPLSPNYGFPTKLGHEPETHPAIFVTNTYPGGYWEDQGYHWFGGS